MGIEQAPTPQGKEGARELRESTAREEKKVESQKGSDLKKGADRMEERSRSSDGKSVETKQQD
ncbi:hypothetical protein ABGN05_14560 [Aquibium sp. LZ166]|uniref:Uncharacterized protein n=1 Tax=Aquibium pacificus TaxID=3153579 RepID=A0ABV3SLL0_9HYPH